MQIVNGRWVDSNEDPISINNFEDFKKISQSLSTMYGNDITYDKINLMSYILRDKTSEVKLNKIINNKEILDKL
jgi:hypothetical protein